MAQARLGIRKIFEGANSPFSFRARHTKAHLRRVVKIFLHTRHTGQFARKSWEQVSPKSVFRLLVCNLKKSFFLMRKNSVYFVSSRLRAYPGLYAKLTFIYEFSLINFKSIPRHSFTFTFDTFLREGENSLQVSISFCIASDICTN